MPYEQGEKFLARSSQKKFNDPNSQVPTRPLRNVQSTLHVPNSEDLPVSPDVFFDLERRTQFAFVGRKR